MHKTVGKTDRVVRSVVAVGAVAGSAVVGFGTGVGIVLLVVAAIMVVTASSGYCPAYSVTGVSTCRTGQAGSGRKGVLDPNQPAA